MGAACQAAPGSAPRSLGACGGAPPQRPLRHRRGSKPLQAEPSRPAEAWRPLARRLRTWRTATAPPSSLEVAGSFLAGGVAVARRRACRAGRLQRLASDYEVSEFRGKLLQAVARNKPRWSLNFAIVPYVATLMVWRMFIRHLPMDGGLEAIRLSHGVHALVFSLLALRQCRQNADGLRDNAPVALALVAVEVLTHLVLEWNRSASGAGILVSMLSGMAVLYVMALSAALLRKTYCRWTWTGATLVSLGIAVSIAPPPGTHGSLGLVFMSTAALLLPALGLVLKEYLLRPRSGSGTAAGGGVAIKKPDLFTVAAVSSVGQFLGHAIHGAFDGESILPRGPWQLPSGNLLEYIAASWVIRLAMILALRRSSALAVQTANAVAVPLGGVLFLAPYFSLRLTFGLTTALAGVVALTAIPPEQWAREYWARKLKERAEKAKEEVEVARKILAGMRQRKDTLEAAERAEQAAAWAARAEAEAAARTAAQQAAEAEALRLEEQRAEEARTQKQRKVASDAGKAVSGAVLAVTGTVAAGATVAAGVAVAAGAVVTAGVVVATGLDWPRCVCKLWRRFGWDGVFPPIPGFPPMVPKGQEDSTT